MVAGDNGNIFSGNEFLTTTYDSKGDIEGKPDFATMGATNFLAGYAHKDIIVFHDSGFGVAAFLKKSHMKPLSAKTLSQKLTSPHHTQTTNVVLETFDFANPTNIL